MKVCPSVGSVFCPKDAVFEGEKFAADIINNDTMSDNEEVASDVRAVLV